MEGVRRVPGRPRAPQRIAGRPAARCPAAGWGARRTAQWHTCGPPHMHAGSPRTQCMHSTTAAGVESGQNRVCHPRTRISKALSHCRPRQAPDSSTVSRSEVSVVPSATSYLRGNLRLFRRRSRIKQRCMQWASRGSDSPGQWLHACAPGAIGVRGLHACRCCHPGSLAPHLCQASQPLLCHCAASSASSYPPLLLV